METNIVTMMSMSLWLLLVATTLTALFWLSLVLASGFSIWTTESNAAGLTLQASLLLSPLFLFFGLRQSKGSIRGSAAIFIAAWSTTLAALLFLNFP
jgi:hypothetical protein